MIIRCNGKKKREQQNWKTRRLTLHSDCILSGSQ